MSEISNIINSKTLIARQGERWDQLCYRAYRRTSEDLVMQLFDANRELTRAMTGFKFVGGESVNVPALTITNTVSVSRPPWAQD